jgi:type IV pilus assembly protein PilB
MNGHDMERAIAALALRHNLLSVKDAWKIIADSRANGKRLSDAVRERIPDVLLMRAISDELGTKFYDLHAREQEYIVDEKTLRACDAKMLADHSALPLLDKSGRVVVALANPTDVDIVSYLRTRFPEGFQIVLSPKQQVLARLLYLTSDLTDEELNDNNVVLKWVDRLLERAVAEGASDIHMRFLNDGALMIRLRVDGVMRQSRFPLKGRETEVVAAMMSKCPTMDSSNIREPQDGTFSYTAGNRQIDARVNMLPQITGPNVTIRVLDSQSLKRRPEEMGFLPEHLTTMRDQVASPQGCIIIVGPTGSGKTTTLYSLLREVDAIGRNVLTVEDPVEYRLPYIGQTQIRADLGERSLTFAKALRAIVRADPDVILVGEVRDTETAKVAMDAAITGHLVLTTLHARSAPGAYMRLSEMGVPRFLVAEAVSMIVSQRLIRKVHDCKVMSPPTPEEMEVLIKLGAADVEVVAHAMGCGGCAGLGYRGRLAVAEVLIPTSGVREMVAAGRSRTALVEECLKADWHPIVQDGVRHLREGSTTVAELARVLAEDDSDEDSSASEERGAA